MKPSHHTPHSVPPSPEIAQTQKKALKNAQKRTTGAQVLRGSRGTSGPLPQLELYQKENCPFSHAVRNKLTRLGLDFVAHSIPDGQPLKHEQLIRAGGKDEVPFLVDHSSGVKLYEASAILTYLEKTYEKPPRQDLLGRLAKFMDFRLRVWADPIAMRVSEPVLKAQRLRLSAKAAFKTTELSLKRVRDRIQSKINEARAKAQGAEATAGEPPSSAKAA